MSCLVLWATFRATSRTLPASSLATLGIEGFWPCWRRSVSAARLVHEERLLRKVARTTSQPRPGCLEVSFPFANARPMRFGAFVSGRRAYYSHCLAFCRTPVSTAHSGCRSSAFRRVLRERLGLFGVCCSESLEMSFLRGLARAAEGCLVDAVMVLTEEKIRLLYPPDRLVAAAYWLRLGWGWFRPLHPSCGLLV